MAREATYSLKIDTAQARREVRQFTQDIQREMQRELSPPGGSRAGGAAGALGSLGGLATGALGGLAGYFSIREIAQQTMRIADLRAEVMQAEAAFNLLSGSQAAAAANMAAVERATGGMIDTLQAQQLATTALSTGLASNATELERLVKIARSMAVVSPVINDVGQAMEQLSLTMANMSFMRLDQLGLNATEVKQRMAELQKETAGMTKEMAFQESVLSIAEEKYGELSGALDEAASGAAELQRAWRELNIIIAEGPVGAAAARGLTEAAYALESLTGQTDQLDRLGYTLGRVEEQSELLRLTQERSGRDTTEQAQRFDQLAGVLGKMETALANNVPGAARLADELRRDAEMAVMNSNVTDDLTNRLTLLNEWLGRAAYAAGITASAYDALAGSAAGAAAAIGAAARLSGPELLAAQRAGIMTPGERERRATATTIGTTSAADWERQYYLLRREEEENTAAAAAKAWGNAAGRAADAWAAELESALQGVEGLFDTSDVTQDDLAAAAAGRYQEKADEYLRQLRDEVRNGVDYAGVDIQDAARRLGIDPSTPADEILRQFEQAWEDSSLFAGGQNLDLINKDAVKAAIDRAKASQEGEQAIIDYFTGLYGPEVAQGLFTGSGAGTANSGAQGGAGGQITTSVALQLTGLELADPDMQAIKSQLAALEIELPVKPPEGMAADFIESLAAQFNAAGENEAVSQAVAIGHNVQSWIGGGMIDFAIGGRENSADLALGFLRGVSSSFYAEDAQTKAKTIGQDIRIPMFEGFRDTETLPNFALSFVPSLRTQFQEESVTDQLIGLGGTIINSVYAGWAAGAPEYDWVGPIINAAQGQAAEQTVDAINESFTINLPSGSVTGP